MLIADINTVGVYKKDLVLSFILYVILICNFSTSLAAGFHRCREKKTTCGKNGE